MKAYVWGLKLYIISDEIESSGNVITPAISHNSRVTEKTARSGDPFFQLQALRFGSLAGRAWGGSLLRALRCGGRSGRGGLRGSRCNLGGGGGSLASCNLMGDAAEAIIGDVQPRALFQEEGIAHSLVRTFAVDARSIVTAD